jgi:hypothetical protein
VALVVDVMNAFEYGLPVHKPVREIEVYVIDGQCQKETDK